MTELRIESFAGWMLAGQMATAAIAPHALIPTSTTASVVSVNRASGYPAPVQQALALLDKYNVVPNALNLDVSFMTRSQMGTPTTGRPSDAIPAAFTVSGAKRVYIVKDSPTYEKAAAGNALEVLNLAGYIAHEYWHTQHGKDEAGAYDFHRDALQKMGAPNSLLRGVDVAKNTIVKK
jgi:hypothetical protein